jgi:hypothetical protein
VPADADEIWNRACDVRFEPVRAGDRALAAVIGFHGLLMSGGLSHGLAVDFGQADRAATGFRFLGAGDLGQLVEDACAVGAALADDPDAELTDEQEARLAELERRYNGLLPSDSRLLEIFGSYLTGHPEQFEPVR